MKRIIVPGLLVCGLGIAGPLGCIGNHPEPMDASLFVAPSIPEIAGQPADSKTAGGNAITVADVESAPVVGELPKNAAVLPAPLEPTTAPFDTIKPLGELGSIPATQPSQMQSSETVASQPPAAVTETTVAPPAVEVQGRGVYMTLGGVIAQVNDTPIYASQVLTPLKKEFAAKAREMSPDEFRQFAKGEIFLQLKVRINDEGYFATFFNSLSKEDRQLAEADAMLDRHDRVIAAGGSVEQARQKAAQAGQDFDAMIQKDYREIVFEIYRHRLIDPLIQVSSDNMRDFYTRNLSKLFSSKDMAQFRVIEIRADRQGGVSAAREKINMLRDRAVKGEDFTALASTDNDSDYLKNRGGCPLNADEWLERDTYQNEAVEAAVWELAPGQITPVIEGRAEFAGRFYVAKLEAKKSGFVKSFEDQAVQAEIYARLRQLEMNQLLQQRKDESEAEVLVSTDPKRVELAVEMAMQKYAQIQLAEGR